MALYYILQSLLPRLFLVFVIYIGLKSLYRLTLHPLAKFPGPKRAAVSNIYAASWDVPSRTSFVKEFTKWHDKYDSPIVRIQPNQLHIRDIDAYNEIYRQGTKFTRCKSVYSLPIAAGSFAFKLDGRDATPHRSMYGQAFSKAAVQNIEPNLNQQMAKFLTKLDEAGQAGKHVDLSLGFRCLAADNMGRSMYDRSFDFLDVPDFRAEMVIQLEEFTDNFPLVWYGGKPFRTVMDICRKLPRSWLGSNGVSASLKLFDVCHVPIR